MPPINHYACNVCKVNFHTGWGGYQYVESPDGERIPCPHPAEDYTIAEVLNIDYEDVSQVRWEKPSWWWTGKRRKHYKAIKQLLQNKTGFNSCCVCLNCAKTGYLNVLKDKLQCPDCQSLEVITILDMVGKKCPSCAEGIIEEIKTGIEC